MGMGANIASLSDPTAIDSAVAEFRSLGRDRFLAKYGFGRSTKYFLVDNGELFDSKAVLGAAFRFQFGTALSHSEFSGGESATVQVLTNLGYRVDIVDDWVASVKRDDVEMELGIFREVGRAEYLRRYGGGESAKFFISVDGDQFDAKAVLVAAMRRATGLAGISHHEISGTGQAVAVPLRNLGFTVVEGSQGNRDVDLDRIRALVEEVLDRQLQYNKSNADPAMVKRRQALDELDSLLIQLCGPTFGWPGGDEFLIAGDVSKGAGNSPKVAWARLTDPVQSPSATAGWYVVLLFAADGSSCYLSLNQGTTSVTGKNKNDRIWAKATDARAFLEGSPADGPGSGWAPYGGVPSCRVISEVSLQGGSLGRSYEAGHVDGVVYKRGSVPSGQEIVDHVTALLGMLGRLYEREDVAVDGESPLHILLRWSESGASGHDTLLEHRKVLAERGSVVWAKFGRPLASTRVNTLQDQIQAGVPTFAYLLGGSPSTMVRASISAIHSGLTTVNSTLIPEYYRADLNGTETCFEFSEIDVVDLFPQLDELLALASQPSAFLSRSLVSQNTLFYVRERSHQPGRGTPRTIDSRIKEVADRLNMSVEEVSDLLRGVSGPKRQMILMGPPGTGKTFVAQELASVLVDDPSHVKLVQFHPSYGYEDFIEGMRPVPSANGGLEFKQFPGILLKMCREIAVDGCPRVLIIDEINRANISKVFGELMYLLEYRDKSIQIMLDGADFSLPDQMIIIGTMNTADRSIRTLDVAMRRRFRFFELLPRADVITRQYLKHGWVNSVGEALIEGFRKLNQQLLADIDRHHTIGHSYFLHSEMSGSHLRDVWDHEIFPLIEDYFFDRPHKAAEYEFSGFWPNV